MLYIIRCRSITCLNTCMPAAMGMPLHAKKDIKKEFKNFWYVLNVTRVIFNWCMHDLFFSQLVSTAVCCVLFRSLCLSSWCLFLLARFVYHRISETTLRHLKMNLHFFNCLNVCLCCICSGTREKYVLVAFECSDKNQIKNKYIKKMYRKICRIITQCFGWALFCSTRFGSVCVALVQVGLCLWQSNEDHIDIIIYHY